MRTSLPNVGILIIIFLKSGEILVFMSLICCSCFMWVINRFDLMKLLLLLFDDWNIYKKWMLD